jgi:Domain of unknown function (DUF4388)
MRGLMGSFAVLPLADLLELLGRRRLAGALTCERGTVRKTLYLSAGEAVGAASNDPREYLGQLLINFGHINEEQLQKAFQTQEETKIRLGKVLTMVGLVSDQTVREVLAIKIRETILDVFLWDSGLFSFDEAPPTPVDELDTSVPLNDIVHEAEFRATAWNAFRGEFPSGAATLEVEVGKVPAALGPDTVDGRLLALGRDGKTIDEIGLALHATDFHLYQRLYALARQGMVRAAPTRGSVGAALEEAMAATDLEEQARRLLAQGQPEQAEQAAARAFELAPGSEPARELLASAERALGARLRAGLLEAPRTPRLKVKPADIAGLRLSSADKYLLSRCDGVRTVHQLVQIAPLRELEVLKALRRFADEQVIELVVA